MITNSLIAINFVLIILIAIKTFKLINQLLDAMKELSDLRLEISKQTEETNFNKNKINAKLQFLKNQKRIIKESVIEKI